MSPCPAFARTAVVVLVLALAGTACSRTPPEPAPVSTSDSPALAADKSTPPPTAAPRAPAVAASPSGAPDARCITPTPADAPPIPPPASAAACPADPEGIPKAQTAQVSFPEAERTPRVEVELATTDHDIQRGLMYRRSMPEDHGMLFRLDERREHTFWMHNTCISLDMLFVDEDGTVVGIVEGATPLTDTSRSVHCPSRYVLEVNAGWIRRHGVRAGQKMSLPAAAR